MKSNLFSSLRITRKRKSYLSIIIQKLRDTRSIYICRRILFSINLAQNVYSSLQYPVNPPNSTIRFLDRQQKFTEYSSRTGNDPRGGIGSSVILSEMAEDKCKVGRDAKRWSLMPKHPNSCVNKEATLWSRARFRIFSKRSERKRPASTKFDL